MARTFRATISFSGAGGTPVARVPIAPEIAEELGLRPGESLRASMRGAEFTGTVSGSLKSPSLSVPMDVIATLGIREGQGVRMTVIGRAE
ncbi:MAG TPA: hypothetical protein VGB64_15325 [Actinomycetota bacterium]